MKLNFGFYFKAIGTLIGIIAGVFAIFGTDLNTLFKEKDKIQEEISVEPEPPGDNAPKPKGESTVQITQPNEIREPIAKPEPKHVAYFNTSENLPKSNATALLIITAGKSELSLQSILSQALLEQGIYSSTLLLEDFSRYYDSYFQANSDWLKKINISNHTPSYVVGEIREAFTASSASGKINVVQLTFSGRFVNTHSNKTVPLTIVKKSSDFNRENAFQYAYSDMSDSIASRVRVLLME